MDEQCVARPFSGIFFRDKDKDIDELISLAGKSQSEKPVYSVIPTV